MNKNEIKLKIDGLEVKAEKGSTILQTALNNNIYIPNLCFYQGLEPWGSCRLCMVENEEGRLITACETAVQDGMNIITENTRINRVRKLSAELLIANHEVDCLTCRKNDNCKLQEVAAYLGINRENLGSLRRQVNKISMDDSNPFFDRDLKKCILCGICVRTCSEILGVNAIDFGFRGYESKITTFADKPLIESNCVSCGECVVACPVGALVPKETLKPSREVKTVCPYCGVGCNIHLGVRGDQVINVRGDIDNSVNKGNLCVKGRYGYKFINHPDRLSKPIIKRNNTFEEVEWEQALDYVVERFSEYKSNEFAAISSARCLNEDNYAVQKFTRAVMGTNNVDNCARSCHAPSVAGLAKIFGSGAMSNSIDEIKDSACLFVIGTNPTASYPVIGLRIIEAVKNGAKLIVADPRNIDLCKHANIVLNQIPGTDVALLSGIMKIIIDEGLQDENFIKERCENYDEFKESLKEYDLDTVEVITGINREIIIEAAKLYATTKPASILYSLGITEHTHGTENVFALGNLALLTGNMGKPSSGVNPIRGQNNVQGACDMGCLPDVFPGYQKVEDPETIIHFEDAWGVELTNSTGLKFPEMLESAKNGDIKAMYIVGENPVTSEPDTDNIKNSLQNLEFLVVQDIFLSETAQMADVVLPGCSFAEKDGTFANSERRIQRVRSAINPIGESKPDWLITCEIAQRFGAEGFEYNNASEIYKEIAEIAPIFSGINYQRIDKEGIQWPCNDVNDMGTPILHTETFKTENGRGKFIPLKYRPSAELPDEEYPLILTTGRNIYHYQTSTMTGVVDGLKKLYGEDYIEMCSDDANKIGVEHGEKVKVISRRGEIEPKVRVTDSCLSGVVFMTFHFSESATNIITSAALDPISKTPEFKVCAVRVEKIKG
ncbi:formate dehydrogenase subunit alpha [Methanobacterium spitsbergense]|uniref:Formate dehydrogenase subunit alpha n=1 Tax=Methanobacterium spitsbergense TaxID=2874285 RepID=A0A8T5UWX2_9EURY|nr:formate dehydrogenase subunit alpha [Methanobacterium spitsbergense]MBZ2165179.1 formate dehydrogenase subunit alpha [Methanobacterium spitsbergense]